MCCLEGPTISPFYKLIGPTSLVPDPTCAETGVMDGYNRCYSGVLGAQTLPCCDPFDFANIAQGDQVMCIPSTDSADNGVSFSHFLQF